MKLVCNSTAESEHLALYYGVKETLYYARLCSEIFKKEVYPFTVYTDNKAVHDTITGGKDTKMRKHLATKYYSLQQWFNDGLINLEHLPSEENLADVMTKQVAANFDELINQIIKQGSVEIPNMVNVPVWSTSNPDEDKRADGVNYDDKDISSSES